MLLGEVKIMVRKGNINNRKKSTGFFGFLSSASGSGAIAGAHNVCHTLCVGFASLMAIFGIAVSSTALMFLEDYAVYFWSMGLFFLTISIYFYFIKSHGSQKLLIANSGILIAGVPFSQVQNYYLFFWTIGGLMILFSIFLYFKEGNIPILRR